MAIIQHNPATLFPQYKNYSHAVEVTGDAKLLFISGLNGYLPNGKSMPDSFEEQGEIIWGHIGEILKSANMSYANIVSLRTYLAAPEYERGECSIKNKVPRQ